MYVTLLREVIVVMMFMDGGHGQTLQVFILAEPPAASAVLGMAWMQELGLEDGVKEKAVAVEEGVGWDGWWC